MDQRNHIVNAKSIHSEVWSLRIAIELYRKQTSNALTLNGNIFLSTWCVWCVNAKAIEIVISALGFLVM